MIESRKKLIDLASSYPDIHLPQHSYPAENPLFIDIETTGFSPLNSIIYAIGCIYKENGEYYFHQLFADSYYEEDNLLIALENIIVTNHIDLLIHFNGKYFDIPFLKGRYLNTCLMTSLGDLPQFDFYLEWKKCKSFFDLPNAKLKTLEKVLRLNRNDQQNGGELITVYNHYLAGNEELLPFLLLHNEEDLLATFLLGHFLPFMEKDSLKHFLFPYFDAFSEVQMHFKKEAIIFRNLSWQDYLANNFDSRFFSPLMKDTFLRNYTCVHAELYHFFSDYANYVYLPSEDMAIHQSVAQFVEPAYRKKATKKTAYIKKKDIYIEIPSAAIPYFQDLPLFQSDYKDKRRYLPYEQAKEYFSKLLSDQL